MKHVTVETPVTLWWHGHTPEEQTKTNALAALLGDAVEYRGTDQLPNRDVLITTTVERAILEWGEDAPGLEQYFDDEEYPKLYDDLNAVAKVLQRGMQRPHAKPLVPALTVADARSIKQVVTMYYEDERKTYQEWNNVNFQTNPELDDVTRLREGRIYTALKRLYDWLATA